MSDKKLIKYELKGKKEIGRTNNEAYPDRNQLPKEQEIGRTNNAPKGTVKKPEVGIADSELKKNPGHEKSQKEEEIGRIKNEKK